MKIAIIGAGTCGLYLGWKLSERKHDVVIFERKKEIGSEVCSGLFSQRILDFVPQSRKLIQNEIKSALIHFPNKTIKIKFSKAFFVMSHYELDKLLVSLSGTEIKLDYNISQLPKNFERIIGCDGADSFTRKELNLPSPAFRLGIQGFLAEKSSLDYVETWPCANGFLWKIPRGIETEYGILADSNSAAKIFKEFLEKNKIKAERIKAKIIPQGLIIPSNPSITLCGDSAGLTKPWSGGGIIWGLSAANMIIKSFPDFNKYKAEAVRFFRPKIALAKIALKTGYFLGFKFPYFLPKTIKMESDFLILNK